MVDLTEGLRFSRDNPTSILDLIQKNRNQNMQNTMNQQRIDQGQENLQLTKQRRIQEAVRKKFDLLSDREKMREKSLFQGAVQIKPLLDAGDIQGATQALQDRSQQLERLGIDSSDTQRVIQQLQQGDIQGVQRAVNGQIQAFQLLNNPRQNVPADVLFVNELQRARDTGNTQRVQDLLNARKIQKLPTGTTFNEQGNVQNITGITDAIGGQAFATGQGSQSGKDTAIIQSQPEKDRLALEQQERLQELKVSQQAKENLPNIELKVGEAVGDIDSLLADKALPSVVGALDSKTPNLRSGARRVQNLIDRLKTQSVLKASESMSGTLSDADFILLEKAENLVDQSLDEKDFVKNVKALRERLINSVRIVKKKAGIINSSQDKQEKKRFKFNPETGELE